MDLVIVRHAVAENRETWAERHEDDAARPLTEDGRTKMRRAVRGLTAVVKDIDVLGTSPLVRAKQTASILAKKYDVKAERVKALTPDGDREGVLAWLRDQPEEQTVAIVGHEPSLGILTSWLLAAPMNHFVEYKKGGVALLNWSGLPEPGTGWLRWLMTPNQLRHMAT